MPLFFTFSALHRNELAAEETRCFSTSITVRSKTDGWHRNHGIGLDGWEPTMHIGRIRPDTDTRTTNC